MNQRHTAIISAISCLLCLGTSAAFGIEIELLIKDCADCHGTDGASTEPDVPIIGGLSDFAIEENLFAFRDGARPCRVTRYRSGDMDRPATDMCQIASAMSDEEISEIAIFFSQKPFIPAVQNMDGDKIMAGRKIHERLCNKCHTRSGSDPVDHASILAGQWAPYLNLAFADLRAGKRYMPRNMQAKMEKLSNEEVEALVHFYASSSDAFDRQH
ncbi:MAG: c-type cytochrome [Woeseiaceae bacterium]